MIYKNNTNILFTEDNVESFVLLALLMQQEIRNWQLHVDQLVLHTIIPTHFMVQLEQTGKLNGNEIERVSKVFVDSNSLLIIADFLINKKNTVIIKQLVLEAYKTKGKWQKDEIVKEYPRYFSSDALHRIYYENFLANPTMEAYELVQDHVHKVKKDLEALELGRYSSQSIPILLKLELYDVIRKIWKGWVNNVLHSHKRYEFLKKLMEESLKIVRSSKLEVVARQFELYKEIWVDFSNSWAVLTEEK
jgi:hypothetical protein